MTSVLAASSFLSAVALLVAEGPGGHVDENRNGNSRRLRGGYGFRV